MIPRRWLGDDSRGVMSSQLLFCIHYFCLVKSLFATNSFSYNLFLVSPSGSILTPHRNDVWRNLWKSNNNSNETLVTHQSRSHWLKNSGKEATGGSCPFRLSALTEVLERRHPEWALRTYIFTHREVHRENVRTERSICLQHAGTQGNSKQLNDRSWESWKIVDFLGGKLNDQIKRYNNVLTQNLWVSSIIPSSESIPLNWLNGHGAIWWLSST